MIKVHQVGALLVTAALLIACAVPSPAAPTLPSTPPSAATQAPATQQPTVVPETSMPETPMPETQTPAPVAPTAPMTDSGTTEEPVGMNYTGAAVVESVDIIFLESFPVQVRAVVKGYLPDGCTTITDVVVIKEGIDFLINMTTNRPEGAMCTMAIVNFEQTVPLDTTGLPAMTYRVVANDIITTFDLPSSDAVAAPQTEAEGYPVIETETQYVMALVDAPIFDAPIIEGNEIGLIASGQMALVTGASPAGDWWRVICPDDTIGDCWVSAAPDMTEPTTPPQ